MAVVTISREFGSQGSIVAELAARELGYQLADKATIESIFRDYGLPKLEEEYDSVPGFWDRFDVAKMDRRETLFTMLNQSINALAAHGDLVIVGRGGFAVLAGLADVLNVRIQAPWPVRVRRVADLPAIGTQVAAAEALKENDRVQRLFVKTVYSQDWDSAHGFDLVIDTVKVAPPLAAGMVVQAVRALAPAGAAGARSTADLKVDRILAAAVEEALNPLPAQIG